jgi:hypothetical protein
MIGRPLPKQHAQRRVSRHRPRYLPTKGRWNEPEPVNLRTGLLMIGLGLALGVGFLLESSDAATVEAGMLFLLASALLFLGGISLLFVLGRQLATRLRSIKKHCGCCRFYSAQSGLYMIGRCLADPSRQTVSRAATCPSFCFSERAMVCDRLAQHTRMLRQLQVIGARDAANQS